MPDIIFSHPEVDPAMNGPLVVSTGANNITWSYNLNTQSFPTYAGEVVQVLSANIDDLQIMGQVKTYHDMERIYEWFLNYMLKATQGYTGVNYLESPVTMTYPTRGWSLAIKPIQLPSMRYGRDVVVPEWRMRAAIIDPDPEMAELAIDTLSSFKDEFETFGTMNAGIGFRRRNPFSDPLAVITKEEARLYPVASEEGGGFELLGIQVEGSGNVEEPDWKKLNKGVAVQMNEMFTSLLGGKFKDLFEVTDFGGSKPSESPPKKADDEDQADETKGGK